MARNFKELREQMSPERRQRSRERTAAMLLAMDLAALRGKLGVTQEELACRLEISQSNVSRLEKRRDMLVGTLREVVEAYGGRLRLLAEFPDGSIEIDQFDEEQRVETRRG
ncbi:MAG: helix-turn-helix transcriptional regulator [Gemmatimonadota bacterium]